MERLEDGREKLWVHIADVSRWIRPGSQLSLEVCLLCSAVLCSAVLCLLPCRVLVLLQLDCVRCWSDMRQWYPSSSLLLLPPPPSYPYLYILSMFFPVVPLISLSLSVTLCPSLSLSLTLYLSLFSLFLTPSVLPSLTPLSHSPSLLIPFQAERRMVSVYMPDERISMFPYTLSTELLSLGAGVDSYALSCGVTLDEQGAVDALMLLQC